MQSDEIPDTELSTKQQIYERSDAIRLKIFQKHLYKDVTAILVAEESGVLSGNKRARDLMERLGLQFFSTLADGNNIDEGQEIARVIGDPVQIAQAEELIIGSLSKSSGIATAAYRARLQAGSRCRVVSGGWKKMPIEIKEMVRQAVRDGGVDVRISMQPFTYLDKNYVRILGGVLEATKTGVALGHPVVVQIRGETAPVVEESIMAAQAGASVVMVDTGKRDDVSAVARALKKQGLRSKVDIAFAGDILFEDIETLSRMDVDVLDIGYTILDAPCLKMRFDVIEIENGKGKRPREI